MHSEALLTTSAAARRLDRSESYIRKLEREGKLRATRASSNIRLFEPAEIDRYLALRGASRG
jgi:excisionase family DNA binding protein